MFLPHQESVSRNQICCITEQEHSPPRWDEEDDSFSRLNVSDGRREEEKNMCWDKLGTEERH